MNFKLSVGLASFSPANVNDGAHPGAAHLIDHVILPSLRVRLTDEECEIVAKNQ